MALMIAGIARMAFSDSVHRRFRSKRFSALWRSILDRTERFSVVLKKFRGESMGSLKEMEANIVKTQETLYRALRRADYITGEFQTTEATAQAPVWKANTTDSESTELYKLADRNIAEYRQQMGSLLGKVDRTEAQCAVFMTTVDALRIRMLNHRLSNVESLDSRDFLGMLAEARLQLDSIDKAIEELDFDKYPIDIPPPIPTQAATQLEVNLGQLKANGDQSE